MQLLLISATTDPANMRRTFGVPPKRVAFVTFAQCDPSKIWAPACDYWKQFGYTLTDVQWPGDLEGAEAIFVCGGNTFLLLKMLYDRRLIEPIRQLVRDGIPYVGCSAGSNVACPTIKTTNDMPIVDPPTLDALGLIPFQINPHYPDSDDKDTPMGQTRRERLSEYLDKNEIPVIGLREPSALLVEDENMSLLGTVSAPLFRKNEEPVELPPGPITIAPLELCSRP